MRSVASRHYCYSFNHVFIHRHIFCYGEFSLMGHKFGNKLSPHPNLSLLFFNDSKLHFHRSRGFFPNTILYIMDGLTNGSDMMPCNEISKESLPILYWANKRAKGIDCELNLHDFHPALLLFFYEHCGFCLLSKNQGYCRHQRWLFSCRSRTNRSVYCRVNVTY